MPVTAKIFFGLKLKYSEEILLKRYLTFDVLIVGISRFVNFKFLEQTIAAAPLLMASLINFSPLVL